MNFATLLARVELALFSLIERGALTLINPLPKEAAANLHELRRSVEKAGLIPPSAPLVESAAVAEPVVDPDVEAIAYYNAHSTSDVKARMRREPDFAKRVIRLQETNRV
jgi:hypothetical protein